MNMEHNVPDTFTEVVSKKNSTWSSYTENMAIIISVNTHTVCCSRQSVFDIYTGAKIMFFQTHNNKCLTWRNNDSNK